MRLVNRKRVAVALSALVVAIGWAWSSTWAHVPAPLIALAATGGGFGADPGTKEREAAPRIYMNLPVNQEVARTWGKLQEKVPMHFPNETSLADVLKSIKAALADPDNKDEPGIQFYVDPIGLQEADKTMTSPVSIDLEGVPLTTTLGLVLKQLGLGYHVQKDGLVVITSAGSVEESVDPTLLILDEIRSLRQEVQRLQAARMGGGMGGGMGGMGATTGASGGMR